MQKIQVPVMLGDRQIIVEVEGETMADCVRQVAPWQALEAISGGKQGVAFSYRRTKDEHEYFALVCPAKNQEFPLGQSLKHKGELFPGRVVKEGGGKKTVRAWQAIQYGAQVEEDHEEDQTTGQPEPEPRQASNQSNLRAVPPATQSQATNEQDEKRARAFVAMQLVQVLERDPNQNNKSVRWSVGQEGAGAGKQTVWLDKSGMPQCSCSELLSIRQTQPGYACPHILAVSFYHKQLAEQAKQKAKAG